MGAIPVEGWDDRPIDSGSPPAGYDISGWWLRIFFEVWACEQGGIRRVAVVVDVSGEGGDRVYRSPQGRLGTVFFGERPNGLLTHLHLGLTVDQVARVSGDGQNWVRFRFGANSRCPAELCSRSGVAKSGACSRFPRAVVDALEVRLEPCGCSRTDGTDLVGDAVLLEINFLCNCLP